MYILSQYNTHYIYENELEENLMETGLVIDCDFKKLLIDCDSYVSEYDESLKM